FILNNSKATVANVYLAMYPRPHLKRSLDRDPTLIRRVWEVLKLIPPDQLLGEGRVYGGGLHKLEPRELANVAASAIANLLPDSQVRTATLQMEMFG
ncbi:MAG: SAM-dependent DNA methyltransferase, partial [Candidatus Binatia bacterium]